MTVDRSFENQFIAWIAQLWPPYEVRLYRVGHRDNGIDENPDLIEIESRFKPMLGEAARRLVFEREGNVRDQCNPESARRHQKRSGRPSRASHRRDDDIGIENQPHIILISHHI